MLAGIYIRRTILLAASAIAVFWGLFQFHLGTPWWPHHANREIFIAKRHIASQAREKPTIWLLGGSGTWFGYDSEQLATLSGSNVVNLGIHAALPIDLTTEEALRWAKPGDTFIFCPEYELYWRERYTTFAANELTTWNADYFWDRALSKKLQLLKALSWDKVFGCSIVRLAQLLGKDTSKTRALEPDRVIENLEAKWKGQYSGPVEKYYNYLNITASGDYAYSEPRTWETPYHYQFTVEREISRAFATDVESLNAACIDNDITLFLTWPAIAKNETLDLSAQYSRRNIQTIMTLAQSLQIKVLGEPRTFEFDQSLFYDTAYHLNAEGRRQRTNLIYEALQASGTE